MNTKYILFFFIFLFLILGLVFYSPHWFLKKEAANQISKTAEIAGGVVSAPDVVDELGSSESDSQPASNSDISQEIKLIEKEDGLKIEVLKEGAGETAQNGNMVSVHYTGYLVNGSKFDSSIDRGEPFSFVLGRGYVIKGWDEGVLGMRVGGKRRLTIPPELGYGESGIGPIPSNATLIFEVELLGIE